MIIKKPTKIRVSLASAIVIGLEKGKLDALPLTAYFLTYTNQKCSANCGFCAQARYSRSRLDMLSRIVWPEFPLDRVLSCLDFLDEKSTIKRFCIQSMNYPTFFEDLVYLVKEIRLRSRIPISISCQPINKEKIIKLVKIGIDRISIPLDASTKNLFCKIKGKDADGPYSWEGHMKALLNSVKILGKGHVTTHFIVGLGEKDNDLIKIIQKTHDYGIFPAIFAFTPIKGTLLENSPKPSIKRYRKIQFAHFLITNNFSNYELMKFDDDGTLNDFGVSKELLIKKIKTGIPFMTSGCPGCNRPYYNERVSGPVYNYPKKPNDLNIENIITIMKILT